VGFMAGISISLIIGQVKRLTGIAIESEGLLRPIIALASRIGELHIATFVVGIGTLVFLRAMRHVAPSIPAAVIAIVLGIALSAKFDLQSHGVPVIGPLPQIMFAPVFPALDGLANLNFLGGALAIMVVGFG